MKLKERVVPKASRVQVKKGPDSLKVYLTRPALDGQANQQLIEVLAEYLKLKKYRLAIVSGHNSRSKVIEVEDAA
jgi:uncharacterized protein (TIGR00251 family)